MEKLNELVEQAKEMAVLHGPVWSSALCESGCEGEAIKHHAIISDSKNDFVIDTGSDANEASWLCDYLELCSPENILAIAEAFRSLERTSDTNMAAAQAMRDDMYHWKRRAEAAEAKLAELEKQQAVGVARMELAIGKEGLRYYQCFVDMRPDLVVAELNTGMELFTRPAPAADLVPGEWTNEQCLEFLSIAFRHAEISGDIEMDDIRLAVKMVNAAAPEVE